MAEGTVGYRNRSNRLYSGRVTYALFSNRFRRVGYFGGCLA